MNLKKVVEGPKALALLLVLAIVVLLGAYNYHLYIAQLNELNQKIDHIQSEQQLMIKLFELEYEEGMDSVQEMIRENEEGNLEMVDPEEE